MSVMQILYVCILYHPVAILNAEFCMTCNMLMLVQDTGYNHMEKTYSIAGLITAL